MAFFVDSCVLMADGTSRKIGDVRRGDRVSCGDGRVASVRRVARDYRQTQMADHHGLKLTPKHAVRGAVRGGGAEAWRRALELPEAYTPYDAPSHLVDVELDEHHEILGVHEHGTLACLTLGHAGWSDPRVLFGLPLVPLGEARDATRDATGARESCGVCGDPNAELWAFQCGCRAYCCECVERACGACSE